MGAVVRIHLHWWFKVSSGLVFIPFLPKLLLNCSPQIPPLHGGSQQYTRSHSPYQLSNSGGHRNPTSLFLLVSLGVGAFSNSSLPSLGYFSGIGTTTSHWSASVTTGEKRRSQTFCWDSTNDLSLWGRFIPALAS